LLKQHPLGSVLFLIPTGKIAQMMFVLLTKLFTINPVNITKLNGADWMII